MKLWLNGALLEDSEARIDPADRGFTLGDGVFETLRVADARPLRLQQHLQRLLYGASVLDIPYQCNEAEIRDAIGDVSTANHSQDAALRITLTRGSASRGVLPRDTRNPTLLIASAALPPPRQPANVIISRVTCRNETSPLSRIKSLNYLDSILASQDAARHGADDAILLNTKGLIAEATAANVFLICGDQILTPPAADGALPGIMRAALMAQFGAVEKSLAIDDLRSAHSVFLSNALGLRAVARIEDINFNTRHPRLQEIIEWAEKGNE